MGAGGRGGSCGFNGFNGVRAYWTHGALAALPRSSDEMEEAGKPGFFERQC